MHNIDKDLHKMPFSLPEGYFEELKHRCASIPEQHTGPAGSMLQRLVPYMSMAAMFIAISAAGYLSINLWDNSSEQNEADENFISTHLMPAIWTEDTYSPSDYTYTAATGLSDEDIAEYLVYSGITTETVNTYFYE